MVHRLATRLNSFRLRDGNRISSVAALQEIAQVDGIGAVELNYPQHFAGESEDLLQAAHDLGLAVTALNLRFDGPQFASGAFTHPQGEVRAQAVRLCIEAAELAANRGIDHVILWMGPDGFDYPLQSDFRQLWQYELDGFRSVCDATPTVRISIEYKPAEPRRQAVVRNMGEALLMVSDVDRRNFGVTLDYCHLLMSRESPAAAASLAMQRGKLFGVHLNDGYGSLDDGMMVGSVTLWQTVELLWTLRQGGFRGTIYFDTFPDRMDPAAECAANVAMMQRLDDLLETLPARVLAEAQLRQDAAATSRIIQEALLKN